MLSRRSVPLACLAAAACAAPALGQAFNIDIGPSADTPPADYGAAANQPGLWHSVAGGSTSISLIDTAGAPTGATLLMDAPFTAGEPDPESVVFGPDGQLLNDYFDLGILHNAFFRLNGLKPGRYTVYVYAWAPDAPDTLMFVSASGAGPTQQVSGFWGGFHELGVTYARFNVAITGQFTIAIGNIENLGTLNGLQLVPDLLYLEARLPQPLSATVPAGQPLAFDVAVEPNGETLSGPPVLHYRLAPGREFTAVPTTAQPTPGLYRAALPALACGDRPEFYLSYTGSESGTRTLPTGAPGPAGAPFRVEVGQPADTLLFAQDFDAGLPAGWSATGLWHVANLCPPPAPSEGEPCGAGFFASYNTDESCTYDLGAQTTGLLVTTPVDLRDVPAGAKLELALCYAKETDGTGGVFDAARVLMNWQQAAALPDTPGGAWATTTLDVSRFAGTNAPIVFHFDSYDNHLNAFRGVQIDSIRLTQRAAVCAPACRPDFDGTNGVQVADIFAFLRAWFAQNPSADFDGQNGIQVADIFSFLRAWFAGC